MISLSSAVQNAFTKVNLSPHFTRIFTAKRLFYLHRSTLWAVLVVFLGLNMYATTVIPSRHSELLFNMLARPFSSDARLALASSLHEQGLEQQAERELTIAQQYLVYTHETPTNNVLGARSSPADLLTQWQKEPEKLKQQFFFWRQVSENHPDYPDAYIHLGVLAYQTGDIKQAQAFFSQALQQNPNATLAKNLLAWLQKKE